ncbi:hypothetical protein AKJ16_DCAP02438, partial [Drosera capensis]
MSTVYKIFVFAFAAMLCVSDVMGSKKVTVQMESDIVLFYYNSPRKVINPPPVACLHLILRISSTSRGRSLFVVPPSHSSHLIKPKKEKEKPFLTFIPDYRHPQIENPNRANPSIPSNSIDSPRICSNRRFDSLIGTVVCSSRAWCDCAVWFVRAVDGGTHGAMDLNASPLPEEDEEVYGSHYREEFAAAQEHVESGVETYRREREERIQRLKRGNTDDKPAQHNQRLSYNDVANFKKLRHDKSKLPPGWLDCPNFGKEIYYILPSKVPLGERFNDAVPAGKRYSSKQVFRHFNTGKIVS